MGEITPQLQLQLSLVELVVLVAIPLTVSLATFILGYFQHRRAGSQHIIENQREAITMLEDRLTHAQEEVDEMRDEIEKLKRDHRRCLENNEDLLRRMRELEDRFSAR